MHMPDDATFVTSNPSNTFGCRELFEEHLLEQPPHRWPDKIIAFPEESMRPVLVTVSLVCSPLTQHRFEYEEVET